jgi:hypothetical protein
VKLFESSNFITDGMCLRGGTRGIMNILNFHKKKGCEIVVYKNCIITS